MWFYTKSTRLFLGICIFLPLSLVAQVSFEAKVLTQNPMVDAPIEISFEFRNAAFKKFYPPMFPGFVAMGPNENKSVSYQNGKSQVIISHKYYLTTTKAGKYKIGSARIITQDDRLLKTKPFIILVQSLSNYAKSTDKVFIRAILDKKAAFVGEQVCLDLKIYTQLNVRSHTFIKEPPLDKLYHYTLQYFSNDSQTETYKGKTYTTKTLKRIALFPTEAGPIKIGSYHSEISINLNNKNTFNPYRTETKTLKTAPTLLTVKALKSVAIDSDLPIGNYRMQSQISQKNILSDDYVELTLEIRGQGDIKQVLAPKLTLKSAFLDVYEPIIEEQIIEGVSLLEGRKVFRYKIVPKALGQFHLDVSFRYFNSTTKQLNTLDSSFQLTVNKGNVELPTTDEKLKNDRTVYTPNTLVFKEAESFIPSTYPRQKWSNIALLILLILFPVVLIIRRISKHKNEKGSKNKPLENNSTEQTIGQLKKLLDEKNHALFYQKTAQLLHQNIILKFHLSPSKLTKLTIKKTLQANKTTPQTTEKILKLLSECDYFLFAEQHKVDTSQAALLVLTEVLHFFEKTPQESSITYRISAVLKGFKLSKKTLFLFLGIIFSCPPVMALDSVNIQFNNARFFYQKKQYSAAIQLYQKVADKFHKSAEVQQNLGLCYLQNKQLGKGILALERALLLKPGNEDIKYNKALAISSIKQAAPISSLNFIQRFVVGLWSCLYSFRTTILFLVSWYLILGGVYLLVGPKPLQRLQLAYLLAAATVSILLAIYLFWATAPQRAIVLQDKVGLRRQPTVAVEETAWLYEGVEVIITEEQNLWVKIVYDNHLTGWLPHSMLERISIPLNKSVAVPE